MLLDRKRAPDLVRLKGYHNDRSPVMHRWGFAYKTAYVWVKERIGLGYWARSKHEHLLIGTRGHVPARARARNAMGLGDRSAGQRPFLEAGTALENIESYYSNLPKIELHRRGVARPGWDAWGAEADGRSLQV